MQLIMNVWIFYFIKYRKTCWQFNALFQSTGWGNQNNKTRSRSINKWVLSNTSFRGDGEKLSWELNVIYSKDIETSAMFRTRKSFSEHISDYIVCCNIFHFQSSTLDYFPDEIMTDMYMFCTIVKNWILCVFLCTTIIAEKFYFRYLIVSKFFQ